MADGVRACENSNPNAWIAEKLLGHSPAGVFGYSHMLGGFAGGQAEYARVPFADVGPLKVPEELTDDQVLFLSDIFPTGYMGAEMCDIQGGDVIAVWGAGPVSLFAIASACLLGAERVIAIDRFDYRLRMPKDRAGAAETINYEQVSVREALLEMTGGRGPDKCIDAVGMEVHGPAPRSDSQLSQRSGGVVSVMNRSLTIRSGQCHVQRYMKPLLKRVQDGEIDPSFVITHRLSLDEAPRGYDMLLNKEDNCEKVVLTT